MRALAHIAAAAACVLMSSVAPAQSYPVKPIRIVTPYAPGGTADILSRVVAQKLSEAWGQQVLVDHRPGASGMIGAEIAAKAAPDGYTILMAYVAEIAITKSPSSRRSSRSPAPARIRPTDGAFSSGRNVHRAAGCSGGPSRRGISGARC